jgi:hypothetical protein
MTGPDASADSNGTIVSSTRMHRPGRVTGEEQLA